MKPSTVAITKEKEQELWALAHDNDDNARLQLIDHYLALAHKLAAKLFLNRPDDTVEFGDYYQYAVVGLIESVDRFVPQRDTSFETYASYRIKGAVLNGVVKASESREQIAFRARIRKERVQSLAQDEMRAGEENLFQQMVELTTGLAIGYMLEDSGLAHGTEQRVENDLPGQYGIDQINARLHEIIDQLPERERMIVSYHYFHHISFEDISRMLNVTKGRVSQIHKKVLAMFKESLASKDEIDSFY